VRVELHCHSTCSDGTDAPEVVAARARDRGVAVFALTDHDTTTGHATALSTLPGIRVIRATELTCDYEGRTLHVLFYDRGGAWDAVETLLAQMTAWRRERITLMAERLAKRGVAIDLAPLLASTRSVGRPDLARAMVAAGKASSPKEAFAKHLYDGGPVDVAHKAPTIVQALAAGREAGAAMALAHPHYYDQSNAGPLAPVLVKQYRDLGLTGLECFYGSYDAAARRRWIAVADEHGLTCTGGSDYHGREANNAAMNAASFVELGVDLPEKRSEALLRWLT